MTLHTPSRRLEGLTATNDPSHCWHEVNKKEEVNKWHKCEFLNLCFFKKAAWKNIFFNSKYCWKLFSSEQRGPSCCDFTAFIPEHALIYCGYFANYLPSDFQAFASQLTLNMGADKPSGARDFSSDLTIPPEISVPPPSFCLSLYLTLSLTLHPSLPVRSCPPSHLSCDVYGPFCFCVLMTTVTESYPLPMRPDERCYPDASLTPQCPWPQRRCLASQLRPVKNEDRGDLGELDWGPVRHPSDRKLIFSPPPSRRRLPSPFLIRPMETWGR